MCNKTHQGRDYFMAHNGTTFMGMPIEEMSRDELIDALEMQRIFIELIRHDQNVTTLDKQTPVEARRDRAKDTFTRDDLIDFAVTMACSLIALIAIGLLIGCGGGLT